MKKFFTHADLVVPGHHPRTLVETAVSQGASRAALFENTGIQARMLESPDARFSYFQFAALTRNALWLTSNPGLAFDFGQNIRFPQLGVLGLALVSSPTVGAALAAALRHYRAISPAYELALRTEDGRAIVSVGETIPLAPYLYFATEALLAALVTQGRALAGRELPLRAMRFSYAEPKHAARYLEFFKVEPRFEQGTTEVEFDAAVLDAPVAGADPVTAALAEHYCDAQAPKVAGVDGLVAQMRRLLGGTNGPPPDLERLARALQTSTRTLRRYLREMNTSYSELLDQVRRGRAEEWVRSTPMTFEQIANELGFSNVRSFRRAFKRWTGFTPGAMRGTLD